MAAAPIMKVPATTTSPAPLTPVALASVAEAAPLAPEVNEPAVLLASLLLPVPVAEEEPPEVDEGVYAASAWVLVWRIWRWGGR